MKPIQILQTGPGARGYTRVGGEGAGTVDRIEIYLTIMDMAGSISIFDNLYRNFDELKIFEKFYDIT